MSFPALDLETYKVLLFMNPDQVRLLVEGETDRFIFKYMLDEVKNYNSYKGCMRPVEIDVAESFIKEDELLIESEKKSGHHLGNREKVERVCKEIEKEDYGDRMIGFVDREYREFDLEDNIIDKLDEHNISGRIVWSRGHSIENYLFDTRIMRDVIKSLLDSSSFDKSLQAFDQCSDSIIITACAISLAGKSQKKLKKIEGSRVIAS